MAALVSCGADAHPTSPIDAPGDSVFAGVPIYVVLYTDVEDSLPDSDFSFIEAYPRYWDNTDRLLAMSQVLRNRGMSWSVQPDRTFLIGALAFGHERNGVNVLRYLRDSLGVSINPHSREGGGYNYADVAYLLDLLGVGGSDVAAGHVRDNTNAAEQWEQFRAPLRGLYFREAVWQAHVVTTEVAAPGTPDLVASGVWRPLSRDQFFEDNPVGNVVSVGAYKGNVDTIRELTALSAKPFEAPGCMRTVAIPLEISAMNPPSGIEDIDNKILRPLAEMRRRGEVVITDYTRLVHVWRADFEANACVLLRLPGEK
jgi:hypothetical protein